MATMRTGASITPEMMAANRAPYVYAQHMAPQHVVNPNQVPRHSQGPIYVSSSTGTHVNVSQGAIATAQGLGAAISGTIAGIIIVRFGYAAAFTTLAAIAAVGFVLYLLLMPETRDEQVTGGAARSTGSVVGG